jgi:predicted secreted protein
MTVLEGIVAYVIIWWVAIFAVLPFGVRPVPKGDPGYAAGAPANPRLLLKVAVTTVVAAILWLGLYAAVRADLVDFRTL